MLVYFSLFLLMKMFSNNKKPKTFIITKQLDRKIWVEHILPCGNFNSTKTSWVVEHKLLDPFFVYILLQ